MPEFNDLDVVTLTTDFPEHGVYKGAVGTIVCVFTVPNLAYEIEFSDSDGQATAQFPVLPSQIELKWSFVRL